MAAGGPVVVLDRDGTLVVDRHYLADPAGLEFLPEAIEGLKRLAARGARFVIITNQSGVARGLVSPAALEAIHERLRAMLAEHGLEVEGIYVCPHGPAEGCECRKPAVGMLKAAARELGFEPADCIVIGDKESDVELGRRVGALAIRVGCGDAADKADGRGTAAAAAGAAGTADAARASPGVWRVGTLLEAARRLEAHWDRRSATRGGPQRSRPV